MITEEEEIVRAVNAARYLIKVNPNRYYASYGADGSMYIWERTGGVMDWLIDTIGAYNGKV